jgi:hypothetical protein
MRRLDLLQRLETALADAHTILEQMSCEERTRALNEAHSQGIGVDLLVAREISVLTRDAELEALKRLNVTGAYAAPSFAGAEIDPRSSASPAG